MTSSSVGLDGSAPLLVRARDLAGGIEALARHLRVPKKQLVEWIDGEVDTPHGVFMRAVEFLRVGFGKTR